MSETKFTKGEWRVHEYKAKRYNNPNLEHVTVMCGSDEEHIVDTVYEIADAYLIAAAPEMYAEIENDLNVLIYDLENNTPIYEHSIESMRRKISIKTKLLAKARGES